MQKYFIDEGLIKKIEEDLHAHGISYCRSRQHDLLSNGETITMQWISNTALLVFVIAMLAIATYIFIHIVYNPPNSTEGALIFATITFSCILIFLSYWLWDLFQHRKKWKRRISFVRTEINKIN